MRVVLGRSGSTRFRRSRPPLPRPFLLAPPALPGDSFSPRSLLGSPSRLDPVWGGPPRAACWQRRLTTHPPDLSVGSARWVVLRFYPLDRIVSRATSYSPRGVIWHILSPLEMVWTGTVPSFPPPLLPSRGRGSASRPRRVASLSDRLASGAGPARATAESLIPVRPSFLGLTGVKGGAPARTGGRREGPACRGATGGPALPRPP